MSACPHWHPLANLIFCTPSQYWFYKHILCRPAPHLHLLANSLYPWPVRVLQTHLMSACPTFASPCTGSTKTSHAGLPHICIPLLVFCNPGWYWFYRHISSRPAPHLHPLAGFLHPWLVLVLQNTSHIGLPHICIPLLVFCTPGRYWFYKHISCRPAPYVHLLANFLHPRPVRVLQTHPKSA